jgi:hypothetical protein
MPVAIYNAIEGISAQCFVAASKELVASRAMALGVFPEDRVFYS